MIAVAFAYIPPIDLAIVIVFDCAIVGILAAGVEILWELCHGH